MRLDRFLKEQGIATRSELRKIIRKGRVKVDGEVCTDPGHHVDPGINQVTFDDTPIHHSKYVYLMMNKPKGVLTATSDRYARTVLDLLPDKYRLMKVFPAGRLDKDTEDFCSLPTTAHWLTTCYPPRSVYQSFMRLNWTAIRENRQLPPLKRALS